MKILFLSQFFAPEPFARALPFAKELQRLGHCVNVLTGFPNYPGGRVYPGYRIRPWQREDVDGIPVTRVALFPSHDRSAVRRVLNYTSFALSSSVLAPFFAGRPDVVYVYHPPAALPASLLKTLRGIPFVYDIQDLWPDTIATSKMISSSMILGILRRGCSFVNRHADHLAVISPGLRGALMERGVLRDKISVIYNWCDEESIRPVDPDPDLAKRLGLAGRFNVMFAGTMGLAQGLDAVLDAAALCARTDPAIQFVFVGGGVERSRLEAKAHGSPNVLFLPPQPMQEMAPLLALADVLLVHLKNDPLFRITIPSKTQAFLAAAKPILMAVTGDAADIVNSAGAGISVQPENPRAIAEAALHMARLGSDRLRAMGARGRLFYLREMSMEAGVQRFEQLFLMVSGRGPKCHSALEASARPQMSESAPRDSETESLPAT